MQGRGQRDGGRYLRVFIAVCFYRAYWTTDISVFIFAPIQYDSKRIEYLSDRLYQGIISKVDHVIRNGDSISSYPGNNIDVGTYFFHLTIWYN